MSRRPLSMSAQPGVTARARHSTTVRLKTTPHSTDLGEPRDMESMSAALKQEREKKEQLLLYLQDKDQTIATLTGEHTNLSSALNAAETRVNELYADHTRLEDEMATRIEVLEKLRTQVLELEKEKRDVQQRYNRQTSTFDAERQAFYDNEQHLKSRIQSLMQSRRQPVSPITPAHEPDGDQDESEDKPPDEEFQSPPQDLNDPEAEPAEMTSLRLELSTLSTSYSSLQSTLVLLQTQLVDLKRVNRELQEENESFMILLRERTLSGQFDVMKQVGDQHSSSENEAEDSSHVDTNESGISNFNRQRLSRVDEIPEEAFERELEENIQPYENDDETPISSRPRQQGRTTRKRGASVDLSANGNSRAQSLADLPITGPGLDLAAELGRAESKDPFSEHSIDNSDYHASKNRTDSRKPSDGGHRNEVSADDVNALRNEVKSLRDANKALSLYASKIIDRIISQDGFEHVLAIDFDSKPSPSQRKKSPTVAEVTPIAAAPPRKKERPQSVMVSRSSSSPMPALDSFKFGSSPQVASPKTTATSKANRRSLSFDWRNFSMFSGGEKRPDTSNLRPLTLKPGANPVTGARKLETHEDDEDRRERERLHATMKLMGIDQPPMSPSITTAVPTQNSLSSAATPTSTPAANQSRFSFFRSRSTANSETSSLNSMRGEERVGLGLDAPSNLTVDSLRLAEAEQSLAALDAQERDLSTEIAQGASGRFTELSSRRAARRSRISGESASTVWSAGNGEDD